MQSILYGKPIVHNTAALKALVANFRMYTETQPLSNDSGEAQYEETMQTIHLIKGSISQIDFAKTSLQATIDKMKDTYDNTKNKEEKKALLQEIEQIDHETHFSDMLGEAAELQLMLGTRLTETVSNQRRLERKLGILKKAPTMQSVNGFHSNSQNRSGLDSASFAIQVDKEADASRTISPPKVHLPIFFGNEEEFPEFWATYETIVHKNPTLTVIEKMLLLGESLQGKSDRSISGIQLLPQNYEWMIKTLHKKYRNRPANRARIVQQLCELQRANRKAESCEKVYDTISILLNQVYSTGQDVQSAKDALWIEAILSKFPKDIVDPFLIKVSEYDDLTVDAIMEFINDEILAKAYIQSRLHSNEPKKSFTASDASTTTQICAICERSGHPIWQCQSTMPINKKREIVARKRLCWKCYSPQHSSVQCSRNNCRLCGRMHHIKLPVKAHTNAPLHGSNMEFQEAKNNSIRKTKPPA